MGKTVQSQFRNSGRLSFVELEIRGELFNAVSLVYRAAADFDNLVNARLRDNKSAQNVRAFFGFGKIEFGAAGYDFLLVFEVVIYEFTQI